MAQIEQRGPSFCVRWRAGRKGKWQTCTFADEDHALAAKRLAEARGHRISSDEIYEVVLGIGDDEQAEPSSPLLTDWVEQWISMKMDISPNTHADYARLLRSRVVPILGNLRLAEISGGLRGAEHAQERHVRQSEIVEVSSGDQHLPSLVEVLKARVKGKRRDELVFPAPGGGQWNTNNLRSRYWKTAVAAAGRCAQHPPTQVKCGRGGQLWKADPLAVSTCDCPTRLHQQPRIHDMRHTHVGWLIDARWDFYAIQLRIGHASIKTTFDVYGHRLPEGDKVHPKALDVRLTGKRPRRRRSRKTRTRERARRAKAKRRNRPKGCRTRRDEPEQSLHAG